MPDGLNGRAAKLNGRAAKLNGRAAKLNGQFAGSIGGGIEGTA